MNIINRLKREFNCIQEANEIILNYPDHKAYNNRVNLHYYHADWQDGVNCNLGDYLSEIIVKWLCKEKGIDYQQNTEKTQHLYAIGSILQMGYQDATVWGTGFAFELDDIRTIIQKLRQLDIRCVRGPRTRKTLLRLGFDCPESYGDPAVLMPYVYAPNDRDRADYLIIPHFSVEEAARQKYGSEHMLSMNTKDYKNAIDRICAADKVVSSSLHGIILAEAYGVPAVFYQDRLQKFNYKYDDWYESTGRYGVKPSLSVEEALSVETKPFDPRSLKAMQKVLIEKFPSDLWGGVQI